MSEDRTCSRLSLGNQSQIPIIGRIKTAADFKCEMKVTGSAFILDTN